MDYVLHVCTLIGLYAAVAVSLDVVAGHGGVLSVMQAGFVGVGAYCVGILTSSAGTPFGAAMLCAAAVGGGCGAVVGAAWCRVRGDYLVVCTLAAQVLLYNVFNNAARITRGPLGLVGIPRPSILSLSIESDVAFLGIVCLFLVVLVVVSRVVMSSPYGRVVRAIREDETVATSLAKDVSAAKLWLFVLSASAASMAGGLYASYVTYIEPGMFSLGESILFVAMVVIGGAGAVRGAVAGAALVVVVPEVLRYVGLSASVSGNLRQMIFGIVLLAVITLRPSGLFGRYGFGG